MDVAYTHALLDIAGLSFIAPNQRCLTACELARLGRQEAERKSQPTAHDLQTQWRKTSHKHVT